MKLVIIYSNKNFKNIEFNEHFNAVIAFIQSEKKDDTHNLGKTSLIRIIDFLLLGELIRIKTNYLVMICLLDKFFMANLA